MKLGAVAVAVLLALAGEGSSAEPVRVTREQYRLPDRIGSLELESASDFEKAAAGFQAKYRGAKSFLLLYVYSARNLPPGVSAANALWWEYEREKRDIAASTGAKRTSELVSEASLRAATVDGAADGVLAKFRGAGPDGRVLHELLYLTLLRTDFVKIRAARLESESAVTADALDEARRELLARLSPRAPRGVLEFDGSFVITSLDPQSLVSMAAVSSILEKMLNEGSTLHTLDRSVAIFEAALAGEQLGGECSDPTLRDLRAAKERNFLREYAWSTMRPSFWADPGDLRLEEFERFRRRELKGPAATPDFGVVLRLEQPASTTPPGEAE